MRFPFFSRRPESPADSPTHPTSIEILINTIADYISPRAREERRQKQAGNPVEHRAQRETLNRQEALYTRGFPVAGHGEQEPVNNPKPRQRPKMVP